MTTTVAMRPRPAPAARVQSTDSTTVPAAAPRTMAGERPLTDGTSAASRQSAPPQRPASRSVVLSGTAATTATSTAMAAIARPCVRNAFPTDAAIGSKRNAPHSPTSASPYAGATGLSPASCRSRNAGGVSPPHAATRTASAARPGTSAAAAIASRDHRRGSSPCHCSPPETERPSGLPRIPAATTGTAR